MSNNYSLNNCGPLGIPGLDSPSTQPGCKPVLSLLDSMTIDITGDGSVCNPLGLEVKPSAFEATPISAKTDNGTIYTNDLLAGEGSAAGQNVGYMGGSILFGNKAGNNAGNIYNAVVLGDRAATDSSNVSSSVILGGWAGSNSSQIQDSVIIGNFAGAYNSDSGSYGGIFIGNGAGANISGFNSSLLTVMGNSAGQSLQSESYGNYTSVLLGYYAGNNAIDFYAGTAVGPYAAYNSNHNIRMTAIGSEAGSSTSNTANMVAIGNNSGNNDTMGEGVSEYDHWAVLIGYKTRANGFKNVVVVGGGNSETELPATMDNQVVFPYSSENFQIRGLDYVMPAFHQGGVLTNDGSGQLSWGWGYAMPWLNENRIPYIGSDGKAAVTDNLSWDVANNRLGIGTATPAYPLDIVGAGRVTDNTGFIVKQASHINVYSGFIIHNAAGAALGGIQANNYENITRIGSFNGSIGTALYSGSAEAVRILTNGNVGLGIISPQYKLDVVTANPIAARFKGTSATSQTGYYIENDLSGFSSYGGVVYGGSTSSLGNIFGGSRANKMFVIADGSSNAGLVVGTLSNQALQLGTNGVIRTTISNNGNIGVGTAVPTHSLTFSSATSVGTTAGIALYSTTDQTTNYQRLRISLDAVNVASYALENAGTGTGVGYHQFMLNGSAVLQVDAQQALFGGGLLCAAGDNTRDIGRLNSSPFRFRNIYLGTSIQAGAAANTAITARMHLGPSTTGLAHLRLEAGVAPTVFGNGELFYGPQAVHAGNGLVFKTNNTEYVIPLHQNSGGGIMQVVNLSVGGNHLVGGYVRAGSTSHQGAHIIAGASTATRASMHLADGVAITSPVDGDIWRVGTKVYMRLGGVTKELSFV